MAVRGSIIPCRSCVLQRLQEHWLGDRSELRSRELESRCSFRCCRATASRAAGYSDWSVQQSRVNPRRIGLPAENKNESYIIGQTQSSRQLVARRTHAYATAHMHVHTKQCGCQSNCKTFTWVRLPILYAAYEWPSYRDMTSAFGISGESTSDSAPIVSCATSNHSIADGQSCCERKRRKRPNTYRVRPCRTKAGGREEILQNKPSEHAAVDSERVQSTTMTRCVDGELRKRSPAGCWRVDPFEPFR